MRKIKGTHAYMHACVHEGLSMVAAVDMSISTHAVTSERCNLNVFEGNVDVSHDTS